MSFRKSLFCCTCLMAAALGAAPVQSQEVGGFIGLMGKLIEQDMHNQQERRRLEAEQQRYREQQQAIRREEQARLDEERRQEIMLVRRLQTALSKLGFYNAKIDGDRGPGTQKSEMAFMRAFEISSIELNEYNVSDIEQLAQRGFRSIAKLSMAAKAGFDNREDYIAAKEGGFETAQDYAVARKEGFLKFDDYRQFRLSGFDAAADYRVAAKGGFTSKTEFDAARAVGFSSRPEYLAFQKSGLSDKASFDKARAAQKAALEAARTCENSLMDADFSKPLDMCLNALVAGADASSMKGSLERLRSRVRQELERLSNEGGAGRVEIASAENSEQAEKA